MPYYFFDGQDLKAMLTGAANLLGRVSKDIDSLNVFPVPDGDTGTNMYLTVLAGVREIQSLENPCLGAVAEAFARGCLLGARGNSGVILSQIAQGFAVALAGKERAGAGELAEAFTLGCQYAYRAVDRPVEGTILTVCRAISRAALEASSRTKDLLRVIIYTYRQAEEALKSTPDLLPVLKEAGVVDAGGKGLVVVLEGIIRALEELAVKRDIQLFDLAALQQRQFAPVRSSGASGIEHTYCTQFVLMGQGIPLDTLKKELAPYGDCLLVVGDEKTVKVHIHSDHPGLVLECGLKYGVIYSVEIDNMEEQYLERERLSNTVKPEERLTGVVAVGTGEGLNAILESLGADAVVDGGATMNPSAQELAEAIKGVSAASVFLLPNNANVLLTAEQAVKLAGRSAYVVPTVTVPQGIAALMAFNPYAGWEENMSRMTEAAKRVRTGEVTRAARSSTVNGLEISEGDYLGLVEGQVVACNASLKEVLRETLERLIREDTSLVTLYYGGSLTTVEAENLVESVRQSFSEIDFELYYGGQPLHQFIISAE